LKIRVDFKRRSNVSNAKILTKTKRNGSRRRRKVGVAGRFFFGEKIFLKIVSFFYFSS